MLSERSEFVAPCRALDQLPLWPHRYPFVVRVISRAGTRVLGVLLGLTLGLTSCTLPTPVAPVAPERVVLELEPPRAPEPVPEVEPEPEPVDPVEERIDEAIGAMDLRTQLAGLMVVTVSGMDASVQQECLEEVPAAGFLLLAGNLQGRKHYRLKVIQRRNPCSPKRWARTTTALKNFCTSTN